jgi:transmembrane sensor
MTPSDEQIRLAIADQASEWFVENRGGPLDREARSRFMAWLQASPMHVGEYLAIAGIARDVDAAATTADIPLDTLLARARAQTDPVVTLDSSLPGHAPVTTRPRVSHVWLRAAAAALIVIALTALWLTRDGERFGLQRTYRTARGEQSELLLPDGSVMHLNTDSQVTVHYSRRERVVDLDRGQALFQVAHEGERGFRVAAGNAQVLDVGTQFDVYRKPDAILVTVVEGTVVVYTGLPSLTPTTLLPPTSLRVGAGYQVEVRGQVGLPRTVDARAAVAWLKRQIAFDNRPLGEVADEFNRYGRSVFEIDDETVRTLPITGVFDAYDADSFAAFVATLNGVVVRKTPPRIRVLRQPSAPRESLPLAR